MTQARFTMPLVVLWATIFLATCAQATVTNLVWYRLGENDPGAAPGVIATNTVDLISGHNLTCYGNATYSSNVSTSAMIHVNSSLCLNLTNSAYATATVISTLVTNFGMEAWVKPAAATNLQVIMYNGSTASNGWGIIISNSKFMALFGSQTEFGTALVTPGIWTHIALVRNGFVSILYVNGVPVTTNTSNPVIPAGNFALGTPPQAPTNQFYTGLIDEARVFTFAPGQFSTNDLLLNRSLIVTNLADGGPGSLRTILANVLNGDTITIATNGTIVLTNGQLVLSNSVNLVGPGPTNCVISGDESNRVFYLFNTATGNFSGMTLTGGIATDAAGTGGAIYNAGSLTLNNCVILSNSAAQGPVGISVMFPGTGTPGGIGYAGGAIINLGTLNLIDCTIENNSAGLGGAGGSSGNVGQYPTAGGTGGPGGGLANYGIASLFGCTFTGNTAGTGGPGGLITEQGSILEVAASGGGGMAGAIYNSGYLTLTDCTVDSNLAGTGGAPAGSQYIYGSAGPSGTNGGIYNSGTLILIACTVTRNNGLGANGGIENAGDATAVNSLIAWNTATVSPDYSGSFSTQGHNLIGNNSGSFGFYVGNDNDLVGTSNAPINPLISPLANNGGPTWTVALQPGSPALGAGDAAIMDSPFNLATDQRGEPREISMQVDIGAYETAIATPPLLHNLHRTAQSFTFTFTNIPHLQFSVLTTTNLALPLADWTLLGQPTETSPGIFQFVDLSGTNARQFYQIRSP